MEIKSNYRAWVDTVDRVYSLNELFDHLTNYSSTYVGW